MAEFNNQNQYTYPADLVPAENTAKMFTLVDSGVISGTIAKKLFSFMIGNPQEEPENIVKKQGLAQVSDESSIEKSDCRTVGKIPRAACRLSRWQG